MLSDKNKVSARQILILYVVMTFSPAIRLIASYSAREANQAAWLTPVIGIIPILSIIFILQKIYKNYKDAPLMDVIYDITGYFIGRFIVLLYIIWLIILEALYIRYYGERIVGSILPNVDIRLFIIVMLILIAYTSRSGIVVLVRMVEIILPLITVLFVLFVVFLIPKIEIENLTPISYMDIIPTIKGSTAGIAIWSYIIFLFMLSDKINDKENIKKYGIQAATFLLVSNVVLIAMTVGTLGYTVSSRLPLPFLTAVKQISVLGTLEKIESIFVFMWIAADFTLISAFFFYNIKHDKIRFKSKRHQAIH